MTNGLQLAITSSDKSMSDSGIKQLLKAKVPCASSYFVIDWRAHPDAALDKHMLFKSQLAWCDDLLDAVDNRGLVGRQQQMSPQL